MTSKIKHGRPTYKQDIHKKQQCSNDLDTGLVAAGPLHMHFICTRIHVMIEKNADSNMHNISFSFIAHFPFTTFFH